ncbi:GLPGLI family protein [Winogradskyella immobilis]|uniref:GLPGLI family protein n=1 Tax=Winogradskyella immobilis TaxID=2816852 RepID=A0ABS8EQZ4_9FLAO|nr:GLPGLI family protein [Winogradskyella immobilis]MCC1485635.1 GLPGLI family protein [Winogradskyella immobilis]MCG0017727.1 GLPGLI family protein [Winogradskyella immobilis]
MRNYFSFIIIFVITLPILSQTTEITYTLETNRYTSALSIESEYKLTISNNKSIFQPVTKDPIDLYKIDKENINLIWDKNDVSHVTLEKGVNDFAYIDRYYKENNIVFFNSIFFGKQVIIEEKLNNIGFRWEIRDSKQDSIILGYKCQKATTNFRGRTYEAYFTSEIDNVGGPWKFDGLPGLILSVKSTDDYFSITPLELQIKKETTSISNPYLNEEQTYTIKEYADKLRKRHLKILKQFASSRPSDDEGGSHKIEFKDFIENLGIEPIIFEY